MKLLLGVVCLLEVQLVAERKLEHGMLSCGRPLCLTNDLDSLGVSV